MQMNGINFSRLQNEEWFNLLTDVEVTVPIYGADNLGIADLMTRLTGKYHKADKLLEIIRKSPHTKEIEEADKERDKLFRDFSDVVKATRSLPPEANSKAAERLHILLSGYRKSVLRGSYVKESAALYNLLEDLRGPHAADVTLLGLGNWVNNLRAAEDKFLAYRAARTKEELDKPVEHLEIVRKEGDVLLHSIINVVNARLEADNLGGDVVIDPDDLKDGVYESDVPSERRGNIAYNFAIAWNRILKKYENLLAARAGRRAKAKEENPDEGEEPEEAEEA